MNPHDFGRVGTRLQRLPGGGTGQTPCSGPPPLDNYAILVDELGERRRLNVLFPNPQSIFDGLHVGFVNVGAGNLSFKRHDLVVRVDGMPVYFSRVYDSRSRGNDDFGDGWRLALGEALSKGKDEGVLTYIDGAGTRHDFRRDATAGPDVFVASPATPSHNANRLWARGDEALLEHEDGTKRRFTWSYQKNRYLLTELSMAGGRRMTLDYNDGSVVRALLDGTVALSVARGSSGRVESVTDRFGRSVRYSYTGDGQLKDVYDVAGRLWYHRYEGRRLVAVVGPTREDYLAADYDKEGRVVRTKGVRIRTYDYAHRRTVVREGTGRVDEFDQNADGVTYAYNSTSGVKWRLSFDAKNRAEAITTPS